METEHQSCPTEEELSEYYDDVRSGATDSETVRMWRGHIEQCAECRRKLDAYERMDAALADAMTPPEGLSERIKTGCRQAAEADKAFAQVEEMERKGWSAWLKVAALFVCLLGVFFICARQSASHVSNDSVAMATESAPMNFVSLSEVNPADEMGNVSASALPKNTVSAKAVLKAKKPLLADRSMMAPQFFEIQEDASPASDSVAMDESQIVRAEPAVKDSVPAAAVASEYRPGEVAGAAKAFAGRKAAAVQLSDLRAVGIDMGRSRGNGGKNKSTEHINEFVRHVWTVEDLKECREQLEAIGSQKGVKVIFDESDSEKVIALVNGLSDEQLQLLVNLFEKRNWTLVSPALPQPRQDERVAFTGQPVVYAFWAVRR